MRKIIVIFGGNSYEREISIITAIQTINNIDREKYIVYPIYLKDKFYLVEKYKDKIENDILINDKDLKEIKIVDNKIYKIKRNKLKFISDVDCALLCTHGGFGEGGNLQGFLDILKIPYTSPNMEVSCIGLQKNLSKLWLKKHGVKCLNGILLNAKDKIEPILDMITYPAIIKPQSLGSSIGIYKVKNKEELINALENVFKLEEDVLIEKCLENFREFNIACYKKDGEIIVSSIEEVSNIDGYLSFDDKYMSVDKIKRVCPAKIEERLKNKITSIAKFVYLKLNTKGIIRFDFMYDGKNVYLNEFNTIPGSLAFYLFQAKGISFKKLIDDVILESINIHQKELLFESNVLLEYQKNYKQSMGCKNSKIH